MSTQTIYLEPSQVPAAIRGAYTGKQYRAVICDSVFIPSDAGTWSGGSRTLYSAIHLSTGESRPECDSYAAPWDSSRKDQRVQLKPEFAIISHSIFCGKDMGLTIYIHPINAAQLLPAPIELNQLERAVLKYTKEKKSSYMGQDRFDMLLSDLKYNFKREELNLDPIPTRNDWNLAKDSLINKGLLNARGAITTKGKNAI